MYSGILSRPRLTEIIRHPGAPIVVLHAPTGYGKTTLVRSWMHDTGRSDARVIWVALNSPHQTNRAFWTTVVSSGRRLGALSEAQADAAQTAIDGEEDLLPGLVKLLIDDGPLFLVIDAYEQLFDATETVDADLLRLSEISSGLMVIVTTRAATTLTHPSHALRRRVRTVGLDDLAFTLKETRSFLEEHGAIAAHADRVHAETFGYPLAVRAASMGGTVPTADTAGDGSQWGRLVAQDLRFQMDSQDAIDFASRISVPPYADRILAAELASDLSEDEVAEQFANLEWHGYGRWIPYANDRPVFQLVETLREIIRAEIESQHPEAFKAAAAKASTWLHNNAEHEAAFELALQAEAYQRASTIFMSVLLSSPESYTTDGLNRYLNRIPRDVLNQFPMLAFARGLALLSNPATRAAAVPYFVRTAEQSNLDWIGLAPPASFFLRVSKSACLRYIGRYREAGPAARQALQFYHSADYLDDASMVELRPIGLRQIAYSFFQAGQFEHAAAVLTEAIDSASVPWSKNYTVAYGVGLSAVQGHAREAERLKDLIDPAAWPRDHEFTFVNALGRVGASVCHLDRLDFEAALAEYQGCESFLNTAEFWPFIAWTRLHAQLGIGAAGTELEMITEALDSTPPPPGTGENVGTAMLRGLVAVGRLAEGNLPAAHDQLKRPSPWPGQRAAAVLLSRLATGDPAGALQSLASLETDVGHTIRSMSALLTVGAAAALRANNEAAGRSLLTRAAALYGAHGARSHLMYLSATDLERLRTVAENVGTEASTFLQGDVPNMLVETRAAYPDLTQRERAVVDALVLHERRADVARALHVSPETVKSQVGSIYRKWGVNSRAGILERAVELGVIRRSTGPR